MTAFKQRCREAAPLFGCWLNLASPSAAELLAGCGYDAVLIDCEHSPADLMTGLAMLHASKAAGAAVLMRVPLNDPAELKRAADLGVDGIMVPQVDSGEEARRAVAAAYYPPLGRRGMAPAIIRASRFGSDEGYAAAAAGRLLLMCQIESGRAVDAAAEIAAVPGVDMLFIGPYDLSGALGHTGRPDHPEVRARIREVEQIARQAGTLIGGIPTPERSAEELVEAGYALIMAGSDVGLLRDGARAQLAAFNRLGASARRT